MIIAHSGSYGTGYRQICKAPAGATEDHISITKLFRLVRGLNHFLAAATAVVAVGYGVLLCS